MSLRWSPLLLTAALVGCTATDGPGNPDRDTGPGDDPGERYSEGTFSENAGIDRLDPTLDSDTDDDSDTDGGDWTEPAVEVGEGPVLERQLLVQVAVGVDLATVAGRHGTTALESVDARGFGAVAVPEDVDPAELLRDLQGDPEVVDCGRMGLVVGAVDGWAVKHQWHHDSMQRMGVEEIPPNLADITVAILDTGVAYEDYTDPDGERYIAAQTLGLTAFVAPWDFVNRDAHPNDDHQHGTHLASLIASQGDVAGAAPGVTIMPVKVLDDRKRGTELTLVRGIYHAIENGADVINLSLSFPSGYLPSPLLQRALQDASDAGVVMVAAAGNEGVGVVTWPAASPLVIAVGATDGAGAKAPYSNWGGMLDIMAPGGDLSADLNLDGLPDGILGETIALNDPTDVGLWMVEGTSQATALVSAVVAARLAVHPERETLMMALEWQARGNFDPDERLGAGRIMADRTVKFGGSKPLPIRNASIRPFLADWGGDQLQPGVWVRVTDEDGQPVAGEVAFGTFAGSTQANWSCTTVADGSCADMINTVVADAKVDALAWSVTVDGVYDNWENFYRPGRAAVASDSLDVLTAAMGADEVARNSTLMFVDGPGVDKTLSYPLAGAYVSMDLGSGLMSSPMGIVATPPAMAPWISKRVVSLDLDGTGLLSIPMASQTLVVASLLPPSSKEVSLDGTGLLSIPMLGFRPSFALLGSSGPLGFDIDSLLVPGAAPSVDVKDPVYDGEVVLLDSGTVLGLEGSSTALETRLVGGAWSEDGYGGASALMGSGQLSVSIEGSGASGSPVEVSE